MIILDTTSKRLEFLLDAAVATNQLPFVASYGDITTTTFVPGEADGQSNDTTAVTIVGSPAASTQRQIKFISIRNADTVGRDVTVRYYNGGTTREIGKWSLAVDDTLFYTDHRGWHVIDSAGNLKITGTGGGTASVTSTELSNVVSIISAVSARSTDDTTSVAGLQNVADQLSDKISQEESVRADADTSLADAISIVSDAVSAVSVAAAAADAHASVASIAATSVDARLNSVESVLSDRVDSVNVRLDTVSAMSVSALGSVNGLQSVIDELSDRIYSVINDEVSERTAVDTSLNDKINSVASTLSDRIDVASAAAAATSVVVASVSARSADGLATVQGLQSAINQLSDRISAVSANATQSVTSAEAQAISTEAASQNASLDAKINSVESVLSDRIDVVSAAGAATSIVVASVSARSVDTINSVQGLQSVVNQLSSKIDFVSDALCNELSQRVAADTSLNAKINSVESVLSDRADSLAASLADEASIRAAADTALLNLVSIVSQARSVNDAGLSTRIDSVNTFLGSVSAASGAGSVNGLQSVIDNLSTRIDAAGGSVASAAFNSVVASIEARVDSILTANISAISLQAQLANALLSNVSTLSSTGSVNGLQSVIDKLSNRMSAIVAGGGVSVTSAEYTSLVERVSTLSGVVSTIEVHASAASAAASVADAHASTASAAASLADVHASIASIAATSVDARLNSVESVLSDRIDSVNAFLASIEAVAPGGITVTGLQSALDAHSNQISALKIQDSFLSNAIVSTRNMLTVLRNDATTAIPGVPVALGNSAASTFVIADADGSAAQQEVIGVLREPSNVDPGNNGRVITHGRFSQSTALWDAVTGGSGGLTPGAIYYLDTTIGMLTTTPPTGSPIRRVGVAISTTDMLIAPEPGAMDWLSLIGVASAAATSADAHANAASAAATSVDARVNSLISTTLSQLLVSVATNSAAAAANSAILASVSTVSGAGSAKGLQSVVNALSVRIAAAGGGSVVPSSAQFNALSDVHSVLCERVSTLSGLLSVHQLSITANSVAAAAADAHANAASAAATSVDARVNSVESTLSDRIDSVNTFLAGISAHSATDSVKGLQSAISALNARVSAISGTGGGGSATPTSAQFDAALLDISFAHRVASEFKNAAIKNLAVSAWISGSAQLIFDNISTNFSHLLSLITTNIEFANLSNRIDSVYISDIFQDLRLNSLASAVVNVSAVDAGATAVAGLQTAINALSNRIAAIGGAPSVNQIAVLSTTVVLSNGTVTDAASLFASVSAGVYYRIEGYLIATRGTATDVPIVGFSGPAMSDFRAQADVQFNVAGNRSAIMWNNGNYPGDISVGGGGTDTSGRIMFNGVANVNTTGVLKLRLGAASGDEATYFPGSYFRVFRLN